MFLNKGIEKKEIYAVFYDQVLLEHDAKISTFTQRIYLREKMQAIENKTITRITSREDK